MHVVIPASMAQKGGTHEPRVLPATGNNLSPPTHPSHSVYSVPSATPVEVLAYGMFLAMLWATLRDKSYEDGFWPLED